MTPTEIDAHVARRLRERRKALDYSQAQIALRLDVTPQQISKIERGENQMSCRQLYSAALALAVEPSWFFQGLPGVRGTRS